MSAKVLLELFFSSFEFLLQLPVLDLQLTRHWDSLDIIQ